MKYPIPPNVARSARVETGITIHKMEKPPACRTRGKGEVLGSVRVGASDVMTVRGETDVDIVASVDRGAVNAVRCAADELPVVIDDVVVSEVVETVITDVVVG